MDSANPIDSIKLSERHLELLRAANSLSSDNSGEEDYAVSLPVEEQSRQSRENASIELETASALRLQFKIALKYAADILFGKESGVDMPIHSSNVGNGSVNNRSEMSTFTDFPMDNHQQQQYGIPTNVGPGYTNGHQYNSSGGELSPNRHHSYVPQVHIDIPDGIDRTVVENGNNGYTGLAIYQAWDEYINRLKNVKFDDGAVKMMSGIFVAVAGQVIAGVMVNKLTSSASSSSSWPGSIVELGTVFGLCLTLAGISLRAKSRPLSTLMIKIGAVTIAWAIIFSMELPLPSVMAWTVGPVAFLIMALAAAYA